MLLAICLCYLLITTVFSIPCRGKTTDFLGIKEDSFSYPDARMMSNKEMEMWNRIQGFYTRQSIESLNMLLEVTEEDIGFKAQTHVGKFYRDQSPIAEISIENSSERTLVVFEPKTMRLTPVTYSCQGRMQDDYNLSCGLEGASWCRILDPGEKFSIPVLFKISSPGRYKINLTLSFPRYKLSSANMMCREEIVRARSSCIFEVLDKIRDPEPGEEKSVHASGTVLMTQNRGERGPDEVCMSNLRQIGVALQLYAVDHNWYFPESLSQLYPKYCPDLQIFICPSREPRPKERDVLKDFNVCYEYVTGMTTEYDSDCMIVFDKEENHKGEGRYVVFVDSDTAWITDPKWDLTWQTHLKNFEASKERGKGQ